MNTDWEKWREPIRKVEPETTDWALHTRIPVRLSPRIFWLQLSADRSPGPKTLKAGIFTSAFLFFSPFFPFVSGRWPDLGVLPPAPDVFPIYLLFFFIYLFIFFACHATVVVGGGGGGVVVVTGFVLKRLFASVATVCLEVGPSAVKHHRFFLEYYIAIVSYLDSDRSFRSSPEFGDTSSKSSCRHFSLPWCTLYVNVKLSKACAELKITYQLYGLSIRNPIRKVGIAEPL